MKSFIAIALYATFAVASFAQQTVTFSGPISRIVTPYFFYSVQVADVNGDGKLDVIGDDRVKVCTFLGNGDGSLQPGLCQSLDGRAPDQFRVADFNGDGIPDLAVSIYETNKIQILLGKGDGTFTMGQFITLPIQQALSLAIGDVTGDGNLDLIASYPYNAQAIHPGHFGITIIPGIGNGTFGNPYNILLSDSSNVIGDFNGDGLLDIIGSPNVELLGKGNGSFTFKKVPTSGGFAVDVNGDGNLDLIGGNSGPLIVTLGNGDGTFQNPIVTPLINGSSVLFVRDFNSDGNVDAVIQAPNNMLEVALGKGDGSFALQPPVSLPTSSLILASGDLNGDGKPDLIVGVSTGEHPLVFSIVTLLNTTP